MGYFISGWPKTYLLPERRNPRPNSSVQLHNDVRSIVLDPSDHYVLTVADRSLHVWSARQHRVLLARFILSPAVLAEEGHFVDAVWSTDSRTVIAALKNGLVLMFSITPYPIPPGLLHFRSDDNLPIQPQPISPLRMQRIGELRIAHTSGHITAMVSCPAGALLATSTADFVCIRWDGDLLWRTHVPELLRNNDAISKMGVVQRGQISSHPILAAIQQETPPDNVGGIRCLAYNRQLAFCAVVLADGPAFLLALHSGGRSRPSAIDGRWLRTYDAVSVALEPQRMLATVGLANGDIEQYYIGVPAGDKCPVMRRLSLSNWYFEPRDVGAATVLRWTEDGSALMVGWEKRGLAVWSVSGCRLMWTLPPVGGTLPTTPAHRDKDMRPHTVESPMEQGVKAACWAPQSLFLWASPRRTTDSPPVAQDCHFMEFPFYKCIAGGGSCQSESSRVAMFGSDRVLLLWHAEDNQSETHQGGVASTDLFSWQHLVIPHDYLWRNWPPSRIAINNDASYAAVAGEHGVAICQVRTQRWRVFGDLEHDRRIRCCALAWIGKTVIIGNENETGNARSGYSRTYELLLYPRDQIESTALLAQRALPSRPILTDVRADGYLLVVCEDAKVFLFQVLGNHNSSRMDLREVYRLLLPTRESAPMYQQDKNARPVTENGYDVEDVPPPAPGGGISEARIYPPLAHAKSNSPSGNSTLAPPTHVMLLRSTGSLILLDTQTMVSTPLLRYVERFWYTPMDCTPFDLISHRPVWWAYGDDGLHVCFEDGILKKSPQGKSPEDEDDINLPFVSKRKRVEVEQWFELDPEVYPLSIMSKFGMLLGATQGFVTHGIETDGGSMPCHVIKVKRQPILHTLLRHLLMKSMSDERSALQVALKCVTQPQFIDSLEWLLYEAVLEHDEDPNVDGNRFGMNSSMDHNRVLPERMYNVVASHAKLGKGYPESPRRRKAGSELFPRVIRLLKYFGEYEDIVVRCARKLDSKRWPLLFSLAGEPAALLEQCFVSGRLRTAACLLVILQEMWGFISSTPHSLRLVEAALGRGELVLAADLSNFLAKADRAGMLNSSQLRTSEDVSWIAEAAEIPKGEILHGMSGVKRDGEALPSRIPAVDLAVLNHARWLLNEMNLRNLGALAVRMDFPLAEWLKRELKGKSMSKPFVRDFGNTIVAMHRQYQLPEPDVQDVRRAMRTFNHDVEVAKSQPRKDGNLQRQASANTFVTPRSFASNANVELAGVGADIVFGSQLPPPPACYDSETLQEIRAKARQLCRQELNYMLTVGRAARAPDIILCCATLLLDISMIRVVLRSHDELFEPYIAALNEFNVAGYDALVAVLNEIAMPKELQS